ncbi:hypothetical protein DM02DRAFT_161052 [Periconia macrospinosa]|uniref:Uncharacterized protein n=1 Tax=Periconia macrospinosa TaxID=97972 RepID=A0A2V1E5Y8_9PLEO|nr:hypothetical protein DM02DRAFT_161052 [Periconia macrospinosa]
MGVCLFFHFRFFSRFFLLSQILNFLFTTSLHVHHDAQVLDVMKLAFATANEFLISFHSCDLYIVSRLPVAWNQALRRGVERGR